MPKHLSWAALVGLASAFSLPAQAQLLTHRDLSLATAKTIAETALESCTAKGYAVSVVVVAAPISPCTRSPLALIM